MPNGVAFKDGHLYVAEVNRILRFKDIETHLDKPGTRGDLRPISHRKTPWLEIHCLWAWRKVICSCGAPCNICKSDDPYAALTRLDVESKKWKSCSEAFLQYRWFYMAPHHGWALVYRQWQRHDGRRHAQLRAQQGIKDGLHFGYPYCHEGSPRDPEFGKKRWLQSVPTTGLPKWDNTAPLGLRYIQSAVFPDSHKMPFSLHATARGIEQKKSGYDVQMVKVDDHGKLISMEPFMTGWLSDNKQDVWGQARGCATLRRWIFTDQRWFFAKCIYRVTYAVIAPPIFCVPESSCVTEASKMPEEE